LVKFRFAFDLSSMLFNIWWEVESNQNENVVLIDSENEIHPNEYNMKNEILNESFQIKQNTIEKNNNDKWNKWNAIFFSKIAY